MRIVTRHDPPPIASRDYDWCAYNDDGYDCPSSALGWGATEAGAVADLMERMELDREARALGLQAACRIGKI